MNPVVRVPLKADAAQRQQLAALQQAFAAACNALAPLVQRTRCWNRVALHHMAYKELRQRFPDIGSQMACNAIYSVSRSSRVVYQHPQSPFNVAKLGDRVLPLLRFMPQAPVYFDRHTLSIKDGSVSMFTLDGRIRFNIDLSEAAEKRFREEKLREIVLTSQAGAFALTFTFAEQPSRVDGLGAAADPASAELPEYLVVVNDDPAPMTPPPARTSSISASP